MFDLVVVLIALGLLMFLTYASLMSAGIIPEPHREPAPEMLEVTGDLDDAPAYRMADEPPGTVIR